MPGQNGSTPQWRAIDRLPYFASIRRYQVLELSDYFSTFVEFLRVRINQAGELNMPRPSVIISLMLLLFASTLVAQQDDEEPLPPPRHGAAAKLGGGVGFTTSYLFIDLDPLNQVIGSSNGAQFDSKGMALYGGQGYGYIMVIPNLRIGYMNMGGTRRSLSVQGNTRRYVDLSVGFSGASFDYVVPVVPRLDLAIGVLIGGGSLEIKMSRDDGLVKSWENIWNDFGTGAPAQEYSHKIDGSFFVYQPSVNAEFAVLRWLGVRAGVSYLGMAGGDWKIDDRYDFIGVPDNVSGKGWMINGGIFLGTFAF
jgi:hypothetical protein